jgi:hypothetical protein
MMDDNSEMRDIYIAVLEYQDKLVTLTKHFPPTEHYGTSGLANDIVNTCILLNSHILSVAHIKDEYHRARFLRLPFIHSQRLARLLAKARPYFPHEIYEELCQDLSNIQAEMQSHILE